MTGVLPFLHFSLSSQSFTHMDAHSSQSFTRTSQGRTDEINDQLAAKKRSKILIEQWWKQDKDVPVYPEPEGDPSY